MRLLCILIFVIITSFASYAADNLGQAFSQGTLRGELRTFYFDRDFDSSTEREDFATGTLLYYKTAPLQGISLGLAFASSNNVVVDNDKDVYGLVGRDSDGNHDSYAKLQEYYIQGEWFNTVIKYGAQEIFTPFANVHDIRMTPKTYKGLSVINNSINGLTLSGYYLTGFRGWSDENFMTMTESAGSTEGDDNALWIGGIKYKIPTKIVKATVEGWEYYLDDVVQTTFLRANVDKTFGDYNLQFTPSFLTQKSNGDEYAGDIDSTHYGFNTSVSAYGVSLTGFYAKTEDGSIFAPWGDEKVIIQQVLAADREDEKAYAVKLAYNFKALGLAGLDAYVFHSIYDTPESGSTASSDFDETDFSLQYKFDENSPLKGLSVRVRYAIINKDTEEDFNDFRVYIKYSFALRK
ncbi:outer membrane porin [Denitrovibrio acetiphilus DSM 12809]|uniref:Outer membrane porin n=1 Tax=Denitrovibrio acetiphilus (strain DSM 12809 / NBRC 114555 / N2460) TaxID=522772 RepID=D4H265_DENA2|nr:OprD family outer membrane porin [Denitrovibrio acetiphilus]ADD68856.1 outer membrane porin [Denitrovibrio acetiphilus DSM 12809]